MMRDQLYFFWGSAEALAVALAETSMVGASMTLDLQILFNIAAAAIMAAIGWFFRQQWDAQKSLAKDLKDIEVSLPIHYVRRDEFAQTMQEIKTMLTHIRDKLDGKADK